jgi:hypothetical protein
MISMSDSTAQLLYGAGILAPVIFVATVLIGAAIRPGYSHRGNAVSELIEAGAPHKLSLDLAFVAYNAVLVAFAVGLLNLFAEAPIAVRLAVWLLMATGVVGIVTWQFPMDPIGKPSTTRGKGHLVLAGLMSVGTMATILSFAIGAANMAHWGWFSVYSYVSFAWVLGTGGLAALSAIGHWPTMGLLERLTIGGGLQWTFVLGVAALVAPTG